MIISLQTMNGKKRQTDVNNGAILLRAVSYDKHASGVYLGTRKRLDRILKSDRVTDPGIIKKNRTYAFETECVPEDKVKTSVTGLEIATTEGILGAAIVVIKSRAQ